MRQAQPALDAIVIERTDDHRAEPKRFCLHAPQKSELTEIPPPQSGAESLKPLRK
jgi:hypothetical protein